MIKDIPRPEIEDVLLAVVKYQEEDWKVYLLNRRDDILQNVMITSRGYGKKEGQEQKTSTLRHMFPQLEPKEYALIEPMDVSVFHLNNEYWVSYFINKQLYDKKYIFVPDSIKDENLVYIKELDQKGVLHR
ncbi:MAG: hypothetical protein ACO2ZZ_01480 [Cyclobacteriaceae bacterium]